MLAFRMQFIQWNLDKVLLNNYLRCLCDIMNKASIAFIMDSISMMPSIINMKNYICVNIKIYMQ